MDFYLIDRPCLLTMSIVQVNFASCAYLFAFDSSFRFMFFFFLSRSLKSQVGFDAGWELAKYKSRSFHVI